MKTFLGLLMVLIVSGEDEGITTMGIIGDRVLLPCDCSDINLDKDFKWQMEKPNKKRVLLYNMTEQSIYDRYKDRTKIFLRENKGNCSILLKNITVDDQGIYRCIFHRKKEYKYSLVNLTVNVSYAVCQRDTSSPNDSLGEKVFECEVNGLYGEAEIQWKLVDQLLTNSSTTEITNRNTLDVRGNYHFTSKLNIKLSGDSQVTCDVKAKGISTIIRHDCAGDKSRRTKETQNLKDSTRSHYIMIIPIMLVLGFSMVLYRVWHSHK